MELKYYQYTIGTCTLIADQTLYRIDLVKELIDTQNPFWRVFLEVLSGQELYPHILQRNLTRGLNLVSNHQNLLVKSFKTISATLDSIMLQLEVVESSKALYETYHHFYATKHPFSQWHKCNFELHGLIFNSAEQYMMYSKALLFDDQDIVLKVLQSKDVKEQKMLGRQVRNFDLKCWNKHALDYIFLGNLAKFSQNETMKGLLLSTTGQTLVEAAPTDFVWGIGLAEEDPLANNIHNWKGTNWLGIALTEVREQILNT